MTVIPLVRFPFKVRQAVKVLLVIDTLGVLEMKTEVCHNENQFQRLAAKQGGLRTEGDLG